MYCLKTLHCTIISMEIKFYTESIYVLFADFFLTIIEQLQPGPGPGPISLRVQEN